MADFQLGKIGIVGNGSWGTALAKILTDNDNIIYWWIRKESSVEYLIERHHNPQYLTSVRFLQDTIIPTSNLSKLLKECDTIIFAVPSAYAQDVIEMADKDLWKSKIIISATKGILPNAGMLLNEYLACYCDFRLQQYAAITGPCHAEEVAEERLSYLTFSGINDDLTFKLSEVFKNTYINTTTNHDIWGTQFAAVLKNIYAVGAGIAHSLDYGDNFLSVYITNCYREMYHFLHDHFKKVNPGSKQPDFMSSAYLGDLLVTGYSLHSRNRTFGAMIGKGYTVKAAILEMSMVAEGYYAARGMQTITKKYGINLPIANYIYKILWENLYPSDGFLKIEKLLF